MIKYFVICVVALLASGLTLFSGFGLGTLLTPAFVFFFPIDVAIALTAIVHFSNDIFKVFLLGKHADRKIILAFGLPAILASFLGSLALLKLSSLKPVAQYWMLGHEFFISPIKLVIAGLMLVFALLEILPSLKRLSFDRKYLPFGGLLSGFFGGLSGHQGALRSAFLIRCNLSKETFIATGAVIVCLIDATRLSVYSKHLSTVMTGENLLLVITATLFAFSGAFVGNRLIKKVTIESMRVIVSILLFCIAILLGSGII